MNSVSLDVGELHNGESSQESGSSSPETTEVSDTTSSSDKAEDGMVMQDVPFTIKVKCPDSEAFELPVSNRTLVLSLSVSGCVLSHNQQSNFSVLMHLQTSKTHKFLI